MLRMSHRVVAIGAGVVALALTLATVAAAQGSSAGVMHNATRLVSGPPAFSRVPVRTAASLKQMVARKGMVEDIRTVLSEAGIPETADAVIATLSNPTPWVQGASCDEATPADGTIVECEFQPGSTLLWMAYRPLSGGKRVLGRLDGVRWAGKKPFRALLFRVTNDYRIFTFVLPMECGNLSLKSVTEVPGEPVNISIDRVCDPKTGALRATVKAGGRDLNRVQRVSMSINGQPAGELTAPSWTFTSNKPGEYSFAATDTRGRSYPVAERTLRVEVCPPPPAPKQVVVPTCGLSLSAARVKGTYEIVIDATRSTTGTSSLAPRVTVEMHDETGAMVGQMLTLDSSLRGSITVRRPGTYHATATVTTPQPVEVGANRYEGTAGCEATVTVERPAGAMAVLFDVLGGKERRVREIDDTNVEFAQCSPLVGVKLGVAKRFASGWELAGVGGIAISLADKDEGKVRENEGLADVEVNKYLGNSFLGTGISFWDLTRSETWTPAWLVHFGLPLVTSPRHPVFFIGEGRLFFDHIDDVRNNYQVWGGVRVQFRR